MTQKLRSTTSATNVLIDDLATILKNHPEPLEKIGITLGFSGSSSCSRYSHQRYSTRPFFLSRSVLFLPASWLSGALLAMAPPYAARQRDQRKKEKEKEREREGEKRKRKTKKKIERAESRRCVGRTNERKCALAGRFLKIKWRPRRSDVLPRGRKKRVKKGNEERGGRRGEGTGGGEREDHRRAVLRLDLQNKRPAGSDHADQWRSTLIPTRDTR